MTVRVRRGVMAMILIVGGSVTRSRLAYVSGETEEVELNITQKKHGRQNRDLISNSRCIVEEVVENRRGSGAKEEMGAS
jgi:hypothetical protein